MNWTDRGDWPACAGTWGRKPRGRARAQEGRVPAWAWPLSPGGELWVLLDRQSLTMASQQLPKAFPAPQIGARDWDPRLRWGSSSLDAGSHMPRAALGFSTSLLTQPAQWVLQARPGFFPQHGSLPCMAVELGKERKGGKKRKRNEETKK